MQSALQDLLEELPKNNFNTYFQATAGKGKVRSVFTDSPVSLAVPYKWDFETAKKFLYRVYGVTSPDEAERVNVQFENPALKDMVSAATLPTLRGGIQLLRPGGRAPAHRHSPNAFRFVLEAPESGAYTVVNGIELKMGKGDLLLTPNWTWHDHHNESKSDVIWFDGLDVILTHFMGAVFYSKPESGSDPNQVVADQKRNLSRFGKAVYPVSSFTKIEHNPLFYYPYDVSREALENDSKAKPGSAETVVEYTNPNNGGTAFPTMSLKLRKIAAGKKTKEVQRTENAIFIAVEGNGRISVNYDGKDSVFDFRPHDVIAIPSWARYSIAASSSKEAVLFSYSDEPVFRALNWFREKVS